MRATIRVCVDFHIDVDSGVAIRTRAASCAYAVRHVGPACPWFDVVQGAPSRRCSSAPPGRNIRDAAGAPSACSRNLLTVACAHRYSHVPLTLLYSSLTKLFLLFCLSVWHPDASPTAVPPPLHPDAVFEHPLITGALSLLDADTLDRAWVVRNVLGGMAAGFGLRGACTLFALRLPAFSPGQRWLLVRY